MSDLAVAGRAPAYIPLSNVCEFIFSNPFALRSQVIVQSPTPDTQAHHVPTIPPQKPLLVDPATGAQLDWQQARQDALRVAEGLHALGLQPSQTEHTSSTTSGTTVTPIVSPIVLIHLPNSLPFAPILYGVLAAGLTATMANPALTPGELAWILQNSKPQAVVTTPDGWRSLLKALDEATDSNLKETLLRGNRIFTVDPSNNDYGASSNATNASPRGTRDWKTLLSSNPLSAPVTITSEECAARTAVILWSSGTSGKSKGVLLSHRALTATLAALWHISPALGPHERWLAFVPFYHVFGLTNVLLLAPCCGATLYILPKFEPRRMLEMVQRHKITFLHMAPPVAVMLAKSPLVAAFDVSSVKGGVSGGASLAAEVIEMVYRRLRFLIKLGYGMSEAASVCHQVGEAWEELRPQLGSIGVPLYGVEVKIVAVDEPGVGVVKRGQEGEILVRSPSVMNCYLNNKAATDEALGEDGWLRTGDVGKIDERGFLWITDRLKEVIKVKGFQVSPSELEGILCASPLVADAGVVSVFDAAQATELPRAYIVPADMGLLSHQVLGRTEVPSGLKRLGDEIRKWVEGKTAHYKWLRGNLVFVPAIPKTPSGKILRRLLKDTKGVEVRIYAEKVPAVRAKL